MPITFVLFNVLIMNGTTFSVRQCRAALAIFFFLTIILAKCAWVEVARYHFEIEVQTNLYVWLPSLLIGGLCVFLYSIGPNSPFRGLFSNVLASPLLVAGWAAFVFVAVWYVPAAPVTGIIAFLVASAFLYLGRVLMLKSLFLLGVIWVVLTAILLMIDPLPAYALLGSGLLLAGALPTGLQWALSKPAHIL